MFRGGRPKCYPVAVEIGADSIKLLQLGKGESGLRIMKSAYSAREHYGSAWDLKSSLERVVREKRIAGEAAVLLPLDKITSFSYILPNMPQNEIESALLWKIRQNLAPGLGFNDIVFDYVCGESAAAENKDIQALVFMLEKKVAFEMVKLFKEVSLDLVSIEPQAYAIIEGLVSLSCISERESVLVIHIGANSSSIAVVFHGHPYLIRPLAVSGNGFTGVLAGYHQIAREKAEILKIEEGLGEFQFQEARNTGTSGCFSALSSHLENFVIDIEQTFQYCSHQLLKSRIQAFDRVLLTGGAAKLKNLDKFLSGKLKVPVVVFDPVDSLASCSENGLDPEVKKNSVAFSGVLGLATGFIDNLKIPGRKVGGRP